MTEFSSASPGGRAGWSEESSIDGISRRLVGNCVEREDGRFRISINDSRRNLPALLERAGDITDVEVRPVTLDDVFLKFAGRQIEDDPEGNGIFQRIASAKATRK